MADTSRSRRLRAPTPLAVGIAIFILAGIAPDRAAGSCRSFVTSEEILSHADVVFTGEVLHIEQSGFVVRLLGSVPFETAVVRVDTVFKGDVGQLTQFSYTTDEGMGGISLAEGRRGVFLLTSRGGQLTASQCQFRLNMDESAVIAILGEGRAP